MTVSKEAYEQNYQQFRSLNQIMWQIPVLAMTLTGGLWFGVSTIEDNPLLVSVLLLTATFGNVVLSGVLLRFRHVMGCYLDWLEQADPEGFVDASAGTDSGHWVERFCNRDKTVRTLFSSMLWWAAACSLIVFLGYWNNKLGIIELGSSDTSISYYDAHATALADGYESVSFESAYPYLADKIRAAAQPLDVLDIGAGTGRDASWIANRGHNMVAVEPSTSMLTVAQNLHSESDVTWIEDRLPQLASQEFADATFDMILLNAVWMHVEPADRAASLARIKALLRPDGSAFVTLRLGPVNEGRGTYHISAPDFVADAEAAGFSVQPRGDFADLLGRPEVSWKAFELTH
ncbi:class I SAM-dependent methyltransferase [Pontivivens ytuae]|uniref:Class I SAM-dependent methyltransferase n=1 Tax=Pontivivens ytuae TaxID=2789856 RepID=A0A7S9LWF4_9RHOB|nr:class I SAM-dependent methyltransferase [Pontivivens ytuae]QPH56010.1 class I SAM-dependent methyltransferase [Pontivivens ytuae]